MRSKSKQPAIKVTTMGSKMTFKTTTGIAAGAWAISTDIALAAGAAALAAVFEFVIL